MSRLLWAAVALVILLLGVVACSEPQVVSTPTPELVTQQGDDGGALPTLDVSTVRLATNTPTPTQIPVLIDGSAAVTKTTVIIQPQTPSTATFTPVPACRYAYSLVDTFAVPSQSVAANSNFLQTWRIRNEGTCPWESGSSWIFASGSQMGGPDRVALPIAAPGQTVDVSLTLTAPGSAGVYTGLWQPQMVDGTLLEPPSSATIQVLEPTLQPTFPAPAPTATPFISGWRGEYFTNRDLQGSPVLIRDDAEINFNWGTNAPAEGLQNGDFSVRWTRQIQVPGGTYRFFARSEDGVRVWVNGLLLFDEWQDGQNTTFQSEVQLQPGQALDVRVEYYHATGLANVHVWAEPQNQYPNWRGAYFSNPNLTGDPVFVRNDVNLSFDWGTQAPAAGMPSDNFSVAWIQSVNFSAGNYQFVGLVDDGMQLYVDDVLLIDAWQDGTVREVKGVTPLTAGFHDITVTYYDRLGPAQITVSWAPAGNIQ